MIRFDVFMDMGVRAAAFSDRADGDLGSNLRGPDSVFEDRRRFCLANGVDADGLVVGQQVHGVRVAVVGAAERGSGARNPGTALPETDGLVTQEGGVVLAVLAADCVPVYLLDPVRRAVGLVHAGRRGTRRNIAGRAVEVMASRLGCCPEDMRALIGPSACPACYEVSPEIADDWREAGLPVDGRRLDLWQANTLQMVDAGVPHDHIGVARVCTIEDGRFFSYRARGDAGRNMAICAL